MNTVTLRHGAAEAYERHAQEFTQARDGSLVGYKIVEQWCKGIPAGSEGIEIACGSGYPITRTLDNAGLKLWAIDGSPTLVNTFQSRFPHIPIQCAVVQHCDFFNRSFDFAVAIGLIFLLPESDQHKLVTSVSNILTPGSQFLLTAPLENGFWKDRLTGEECHSLGRENYEKLFNDTGFRVLKTNEDVGQNNYFHLLKE